MGEVVILPRHARTSRHSRAANRARRSAVTPPSDALDVAKTDDHHSAGILSRWAHFRTCVNVAPISSANASCLGQSPMIALNESTSDMPRIMGLSVPECKPIVSRDKAEDAGHHVPMRTEPDEQRIDSQWRTEFRDRLVESRGSRTQKDMAELLGITHDAYRKYESSRKSMMSPRLFPLFCKICGISLQWLLTGQDAEKALKPQLGRRKKKVA